MIDKSAFDISVEYYRRDMSEHDDPICVRFNPVAGAKDDWLRIFGADASVRRDETCSLVIKKVIVTERIGNSWDASNGVTDEVLPIARAFAVLGDIIIGAVWMACIRMNMHYEDVAAVKNVAKYVKNVIDGVTARVKIVGDTRLCTRFEYENTLTGVKLMILPKLKTASDEKTKECNEWDNVHSIASNLDSRFNISLIRKYLNSRIDITTGIYVTTSSNIALKPTTGAIHMITRLQQATSLARIEREKIAQKMESWFICADELGEDIPKIDIAKRKDMFEAIVDKISKEIGAKSEPFIESIKTLQSTVEMAVETMPINNEDFQDAYSKSAQEVMVSNTIFHRIVALELQYGELKRLCNPSIAAPTGQSNASSSTSIITPPKLYKAPVLEPIVESSIKPSDLKTYALKTDNARVKGDGDDGGNRDDRDDDDDDDGDKDDAGDEDDGDNDDGGGDNDVDEDVVYIPPPAENINTNVAKTQNPPVITKNMNQKERTEAANKTKAFFPTEQKKSDQSRSEGITPENDTGSQSDASLVAEDIDDEDDGEDDDDIEEDDDALLDMINQTLQTEQNK
jgi:hypothetical protein